ncbi:ABC transporter permease [Marasmitruncus massiliensis]|uniref:ABC transporter permease n=1 Tax=Marasmitruncus massiliensis TaxID=1944642 RepID=UPI000C7B0EE5|nr:ABC transporter permease [Marasmitruncus massiliensis]
MDGLTQLSLFLQVSVQMGTPILFGTLGGILCEKVGHINLGVEGMMLMGAVFGFMASVATGNPAFAVLAAGIAGAFGALIYAVITVSLRGNHTVTGLALTIFGSGVAGLLGKQLTGMAQPEHVIASFAAYSVPGLSKIPVLGEMFFQQSIYVQIAPVCAVLLYLYLNKTYVGLNLRAIGENPGAADASGIKVNLYKYLHIVAGGFLCGMGGAYLSIVFVPHWQDNITAGIGWIAVALVIFSTWNPLKAIGGAYFFGILRGIGYKLQNADMSLFGRQIQISSQLLDMIPYLMTIIVLVLIVQGKRRENQPPHALGNPYFREER